MTNAIPNPPRRRLSRWMPPLPEAPMSARQKIGCAALAAAGLALLVFSAAVQFAVGLLVVIFVAHEPFHRRRMRRMAAERAGESICTFARALDRRAVDPWVVRAVHDRLQPYAMAGKVTVPLRVTDRLYKDLRVDDDELDDVARDVARRTGRTLDEIERNPACPVVTVGDLVRFFSHQPRAAEG